MIFFTIWRLFTDYISLTTIGYNNCLVCSPMIKLFSIRCNTLWHISHYQITTDVLSCTLYIHYKTYFIDTGMLSANKRLWHSSQTPSSIPYKTSKVSIAFRPIKIVNIITIFLFLLLFYHLIISFSKSFWSWDKFSNLSKF